MYGSNLYTSFKGVIFDFEGTIVDFQWNLEEGEEEAREVLRKAGVNTDLSNLNYAGIYNLAVELGLVDVVKPVFNKWDLDALKRWRKRDGIDVVLQTFKKHGIKTGLLSNVGRTALDRALKKLGLEGYFDVTVSRNDMPFLKPHPSSVDTMLKKLSLKPHEVLYVGDSISDLLAARSRNIKIVLFCDGESSKKELLKMGADAFISSPEDLLKIVLGGIQ